MRAIRWIVPCANHSRGRFAPWRGVKNAFPRNSHSGAEMGSGTPEGNAAAVVSGRCDHRRVARSCVGRCNDQLMTDGRDRRDCPHIPRPDVRLAGVRSLRRGGVRTASRGSR